MGEYCFDRISSIWGISGACHDDFCLPWWFFRQSSLSQSGNLATCRHWLSARMQHSTRHMRLPKLGQHTALIAWVSNVISDWNETNQAGCHCSSDSRHVTPQLHHLRQVQQVIKWRYATPMNNHKRYNVTSQATQVIESMQLDLQIYKQNSNMTITILPGEFVANFSPGKTICISA